MKHIIDGVEIDMTPQEIGAWEADQASNIPTYQQKMATLRIQRDARLAASDWTQVSDAPVDQVAWAVYRQALRDLPDTITDPNNFSWPTPPAGTGVVT